MQISQVNSLKILRNTYFTARGSQRLTHPELRQKAIVLYRYGYKYDVIADILGFTREQVKYVLRIQPNFKELKKEHDKNYDNNIETLSDNQKAQIIEMYKKGMPISDIAKSIDCYYSILAGFLHKQENFEQMHTDALKIRCNLPKDAE